MGSRVALLFPGISHGEDIETTPVHAVISPTLFYGHFWRYFRVQYIPASRVRSYPVLSKEVPPLVPVNFGHVG